MYSPAAVPPPIAAMTPVNDTPSAIHTALSTAASRRLMTWGRRWTIRRSAKSNAAIPASRAPHAHRGTLREAKSLELDCASTAFDITALSSARQRSHRPRMGRDAGPNLGRGDDTPAGLLPSGSSQATGPGRQLWRPVIPPREGRMRRDNRDGGESAG